MESQRSEEPQNANEIKNENGSRSVSPSNMLQDPKVQDRVPSPIPGGPLNENQSPFSGSAISQRPGSANSQKPGSENSQRPGSANSKRPGSANSQRPVSANSQHSIRKSGFNDSPIVNATEVESLQAVPDVPVPSHRRASAVTILDMESEDDEQIDVS